jgi:hypothetical protein
MRYKIINAETTEQLAQGYTEEKMEVGAKSSSVLGVSQARRAASRSTRWCSGWCRSRFGKSTTSTSDRQFPDSRRRHPAGVAAFDARVEVKHGWDRQPR